MARMFSLILHAIATAFRSHDVLALENLALRQQLALLQRNPRRPRLGPWDRRFWILGAWLWSDWRKAVVVVQPETVVHQDIVYAKGNPIQVAEAVSVRPDGSRTRIIRNGAYVVF